MPSGAALLEDFNPYPDHERTRVFDEKQYTRIYATLAKWRAKKRAPVAILNAFEFLILIGSRRGETWKLRWEDDGAPHTNFVEWEKGKPVRLILRDYKDCDGTIEVIEVTREMEAALMRYRADRIVGNPFVFPSGRHPKKRTHIVCPRVTWDKLLEAAEVDPATFHDVRRSFVTYLIDTGVAIEDVSRAVRHKSIETTKKYYHKGDKAKFKRGEAAKLRPAMDRMTASIAALAQSS